MKSKQQLFIINNLPHAKKAEEVFGLNPVVILAQAALETGWGESELCRVYNNYFGITGYGKSNDYWDGSFVELASGSLKFRKYDTPRQSFMDYARLITSCYKSAAAMSYHPEAFAKEIAYSKYISEVNGDNREQYRKAVASISRQIATHNHLFSAKAGIAEEQAVSYNL